MTENTAIAVTEETPVGNYNQASQLLADIVSASRDPAVDAGKITALANLAMGMQDREAERRFRMAKHNAVLEMPTIAKNGAIKNKQGEVQSRYSKFEDIMRVVAPILGKHRLILTFNVDHEGQMVTVQPILSFSDGDLAYEEKGGAMVLAVDTTGSKNATQGAGSAASYGKRHSAKAMLNIIEEGEDNDGQGDKRTGYEAMSDDLRKLIDASREKAMEGSAAYSEWFKALSQDDRGFLAFNYSDTGETWHAQNKKSAAAADK